MRCERTSNWTWTKVGKICKTNLSSYSLLEQWPFVNYLETKGITEGRITETQYLVPTERNLPSRARRKVLKNDIVYSTVRPNQRHYGIIKNPLPNMLVSTGFSVLTVDPVRCDAVFLYYWLSQNRIVETLQSLAEQSVSTYPTIRDTDLGALEIFLPPLPEQKRIAAILSSLDDKIELNNKINANLEQQAQALFKAWFVDFEPFGGKMPDDWSVSSLTYIAHYLNGLAMQKYRPRGEDGSIPVLKIKELRQGYCDAASDRCSAKIPSEYIIHDGDVIFSWSGSLLVDFWCGGKCGLNQHLFKVTSSHYDTWFFYSWTKYHLARFIAIAADKATTMGHIKRDALEDAKVLIPSEWDYQMLGNILAPMYRKIVCNRIENRKLARLRDMLLQRLMSGEIDVSDISFPKL